MSNFLLLHMSGEEKKRVEISEEIEKSANQKQWFIESRTHLWCTQQMLLVGGFFTFGGYFYWNYNYRDLEQRICMQPGLDPLHQQYLLVIVGATLSQSLAQFMRILLRTVCFMDIENRLRHPWAVLMSMTIHLIVSSMNVGMVLSEHITCLDYFGIRTSPFLWMEWCTTVPFLFFLISFLDVKKSSMKQVDVLVQFMAGVSLYCLFLVNEHLPEWVILLAFVAANVLMTWALLWLLYDAYIEHSAALKVMMEIPRDDWESFLYKDRHDELVVSQWKMNCTVFIAIFLNAFPLLYYLNMVGMIDFVTFTFTIHTCSVLSKVVLYNIICDGHMEVIDVNKMLLIEEKKRNAASKRALLRYVFHEVRVPLNSITLGTELLMQNPSLTDEEVETLFMMKDASMFMTDTLNDVLSLQKIEDGKLQLEEKLFPPHVIIKSMLSNLRSQYESKCLTIYVDVKSMVPLEIMGDQFRLEHVLGNLLSNAIKFSDNKTRIWIKIHRDGNYVYFSVKDEGPGMTEAERKCLFSPFVQIRAGELQKGRGSGLGLSICKTIISLSKGVIGCTSTPREGDDVTTGGSEFFFGIKISGSESTKLGSGDDAVDDAAIATEDSATKAVDDSEELSQLSDEQFSAVLNSLQLERVNAMQAYEVCIEPHTRRMSRADVGSDTSTRSSSPVPVYQSVKSAQALLASNDENSSSRSSSIAVMTPSNSNERKKNVTVKSLNEDDSKMDEELFVDAAKCVRNILVVDDVLSNRKILKLILSHKNFECEQASNGKEALEMVRKKGFDYYQLIFMDSVMPIMNGPTATSALRVEGYMNLLVAVTGNAMEGDVEDFENAGADVVLAKPLKSDHLNTILSYCVQHGVLSDANSKPLKSFVKAAQK